MLCMMYVFILSGKERKRVKADAHWSTLTADTDGPSCWLSKTIVGRQRPSGQRISNELVEDGLRRPSVDVDAFLTSTTCCDLGL